LVLFVVPAGALQVDTVQVAPVLGFLFHLLPGHVIQDLELEADLIDSDDVFSGEVLERSGYEGLWEEEPTDPEDVEGVPLSIHFWRN
jgi:hypothetical protein